MDERRSGPADPDLVEGATHAGVAHLVVDHELGDGVGRQAPRAGPVRGDVPGFGELAGRGVGVGRQPRPELGAGAVLFSGQDEVHGQQRRLRPMSDWNFADVWEAVAETVPDGLCAIHGDRRVTWADTERRANGVAAFLVGLGVERQDKVAHYLYNGPEYMESTFAILKVGLVPVNTNYRYTDDELVYLWDNADAVAVIFHGTFSARIAGLRATGAAACGPGCGSTTAATRARRGPPPTRTPRPPPPGASRHRGAAAATTSTFCTRGGRPACPRA